MQQIRVSKVSVRSKGYNPSQPRVPAGQEGGGRWTSSGGGAARTTGGTETTPPERRPWNLTPEQWAKHVASRAGYPGLPPHNLTWEEEMGFLSGRHEVDLRLQQQEPRIRDYDVYTGTIGSPATPDVEDVTLDLTHPKYPNDEKVATYQVDRGVARLVVGRDEIGWPAPQLVITDDRYRSEFPARFYDQETDETGVWRGMAGEEMEEAIGRGHIRSRAQLTLSGQEEATFFSTRPSSAATYASSFAPWYAKPTFETPSYVVRVNRPPESSRQIGRSFTSDEFATTAPVPVEDITSVWEVRLAAERPIQARVVLDIRTLDLNVYHDDGADHFYVYREIPRSEWRSIRSYHERASKRR